MVPVWFGTETDVQFTYWGALIAMGIAGFISYLRMKKSHNIVVKVAPLSSPTTQNAENISQPQTSNDPIKQKRQFDTVEWLKKNFKIIIGVLGSAIVLFGVYYLFIKHDPVSDAKNPRSIQTHNSNQNQDEANEYNERGNDKSNKGDFAGAIQDYDKAIQLDPKYVTAYYNRGRAKASMGNLTEAIKDYDKSISLGYKEAATYYNRGNAKRRKGDYDAAIRDYNMAIQKDPNYPLAYFNRGLAFAAMNNHDEAIEDIDQAIKFDPNNHLFYNGKGVSQLNLGQYLEAFDNFNICIQIKPDFGQAYSNRGFLKLQGLNDTTGACKDWEIAIAKGYKSANDYLNKYCR